jgi:uncharacterized protein (DUF1015 family)
MAEVRAFRALRYDERVAGALSDLICPPYDVISPERRAQLAARDERNFVHVELPSADAAGYRAAAERLRSWRADGSLKQDIAASVYVHEHTFSLGSERATRRGVFVALRLHRTDEGVVLPHEHTFPKAKADRLELLRATRANTSPVFGLIDAKEAIEALVPFAHEIAKAKADGDDHRLSWVTSPDAIAEFASRLRERRVYIADGHHRYETALTYADERRAATDAPERFVLTSLTSLDDPGVRIFATHRVVRGQLRALEDAAARSFERSPIDRGALGDVQPGIVLVRDGHFTRLEARDGADRSRMPAAWRDLPVALAEELLLKTAREAGAEVTYEHDTDRAIAQARGDTAAILLRAVAPATLRAVSDAGERMPQKTTYFYPKVPAGLVTRTLDDTKPTAARD